MNILYSNPYVFAALYCALAVTVTLAFIFYRGMREYRQQLLCMMEGEKTTPEVTIPEVSETDSQTVTEEKAAPKVTKYRTEHNCFVTLKSGQRIECLTFTNDRNDFDEFNDFIHWFEHDFSLFHSFGISQPSGASELKYVFNRDSIASIVYNKHIISYQV